jgi:hypothetical protein
MWRHIHQHRHSCTPPFAKISPPTNFALASTELAVAFRLVSPVNVADFTDPAEPALSWRHFQTGSAGTSGTCGYQRRSPGLRPRITASVTAVCAHVQKKLTHHQFPLEVRTPGIYRHPVHSIRAAWWQVHLTSSLRPPYVTAYCTPGPGFHKIIHYVMWNLLLLLPTLLCVTYYHINVYCREITAVINSKFCKITLLTGMTFFYIPPQAMITHIGWLSYLTITCCHFLPVRLLYNFGRGYTGARTNTTKQSGQTPHKEVQANHCVPYCSGYTESDSFGVVSPNNSLLPGPTK